MRETNQVFILKKQETLVGATMIRKNPPLKVVLVAGI